MPCDVNPTLTEITKLILETLRSDDRRRFAVAHRISKTAVRFSQVFSLRVEDFDDDSTSKRRRGVIGYFKEHDHTPQVLVPDNPTPATEDVLTAMSAAVVKTLHSTDALRFSAVERILDCALCFIAGLLPPKRGSNKEDAGLECEDPEGDYIRQGRAQMAAARMLGEGDTEQLQRETLEVQGTNSQILGELALAKVAQAEAAELESLLAIQRTSADPSLMTAAAERIEALRERLVFRLKGTNGLVSTNVPRGHQPGSAGEGDDGAQGHEHEPQRTTGPRSLPQARAEEPVRLQAVGDG